jgi:hypothetical protein
VSHGRRPRRYRVRPSLGPAGPNDNRTPQRRPFARRWRTASNSAIPVATDTFRLDTMPAIGIDTSRSQLSRTSRRSPVPSAPTTKAVGAV